jgi:amidase
MNDIAFLDGTAQAELVRRKEVKPIELVDAAIERIERLNPVLNAVVTPMYEKARRVASGPLPDGPFTGVPYVLKDLGAEYTGTRLTEGSALLRDYVSDHDTELVIRLKKAGLIILGKTSTPEFGLLPTSEPRLFGPAHNPWDPTRTTGGSSGGSGAAVASGMLPMAHGNDGGGSIRIPASCCGVFGLKPTRARTPMGPDLAEDWHGLVIGHALTRSVRDSAALLDATAGPELGDPYWAPPPERPFIEEVGAEPGRLRIAFTADGGGTVAVHSDCVAAVTDAAALCAELGHEVVEASPDLDQERITQSVIGLITASTTAQVDYWARRSGRAPTEELLEPYTWALYQAGRQRLASEYILSVQDLQRLSRDVARFFLDFDVWLTPTLAEPPPALGSFDPTPGNPLQGLFRSAAFMPFTPICNVTGQPAMSVPLYWNDEGLPVGVHFASRFGDEATLFRLAAQLEQARPWVGRRPPISAAAAPGT